MSVGGGVFSIFLCHHLELEHQYYFTRKKKHTVNLIFKISNYISKLNLGFDPSFLLSDDFKKARQIFPI